MFSPIGTALELLLAGFLYTVYIVIWRLYWSPIAQFPGPRLAAATHLYELYYELWKGGQFVFKKMDLHEKYGPIVRINPWELHVSHPDFYEELYAKVGRRRDKFQYHAAQFGNPESAFGTVSHDLHRLRRGALNKFFSKASITRLEPLIQSIVDGLCTRLEAFQAEKKVVLISGAYSCVTNDVICHYALGKNYNFVNTSKEFRSSVTEAISELGVSARYLKQAPWIAPLLEKTPRWIMELACPDMLALLDFQAEVDKAIMPIFQTTAYNTSQKQDQSPDHATIFHEILAGDLPAEEKTFNRLRKEGMSLLGAGTETVAWTLSVTTYHILANPEIHLKLIQELRPIFEKARGQPSWTQLEQLPYLNSVISEGLRLSFGVSAPLPRIAPDEILVFREWTIPAGVPVSMTSVLIHLNPDIFPSPEKFRPERWLENPKLSRHLVSFSRGSRQCVGMNLAYAELFLTLSYLIMKFPNMKLHETTVADVELVADDFIPRSSKRGVRVLLE